jgi:hypothetical protein
MSPAMTMPRSWRTTRLLGRGGWSSGSRGGSRAVEVGLGERGGRHGLSSFDTNPPGSETNWCLGREDLESVTGAVGLCPSSGVDLDAADSRSDAADYKSAAAGYQNGRRDSPARCRAASRDTRLCLPLGCRAALSPFPPGSCPKWCDTPGRSLLSDTRAGSSRYHGSEDGLLSALARVGPPPLPGPEMLCSQAGQRARSR